MTTNIQDILMDVDNISSIIKVIGVGGGGNNAVNHMYHQGIKDVEFVVCNTDIQALNNSPIQNKIQIGKSLTQGLGAGSLPERGKQSAEENMSDIEALLQDNTKMVFVTAGMGGGTGTGAAPVIAGKAHEMGILTVGIVTLPFKFEAKNRYNQAVEGIKEMKRNVDALLVIDNDKLRDMYGNLAVSQAFAQADNVLTVAAKGIAEIITGAGYINVDFADVCKIMKESGTTVMGSSRSSGENRAINAIKEALVSPLLNNGDITGAKGILLNVEYGTNELTMDELTDITDYIYDQISDDAEFIWGLAKNDNLGDEINVTIIATRFPNNGLPSSWDEPKEKVNLDGDPVTNEKLSQSGAGAQEASSEAESVDSSSGSSWKWSTAFHAIDTKVIDELENIPAYRRNERGSSRPASRPAIDERQTSFDIFKIGMSQKNPYMNPQKD